MRRSLPGSAAQKFLSRRNLRAVVGVLAALALLTPALHAADDVLTLQTALELARVNLEEYKLADLQRSRAQEQVLLALSALLPKVSARVRGDLQNEHYSTTSGALIRPGTLGQVSGTVSEIAFTGAALPQLQATQEQHLGVLQAMMRRDQLLAYEVVQAYYVALAADRQVAVREQAVRSTAESLRVSQQRVEGGVATPLSVARAELEAARATAALEQARLAQARTRTALGYYVGGTVTRSLVPPSAPEGVLPDGATLVQKAKVRRGDLRALGHSKRAARILAESAWMSWLPTVSITGAVAASTFAASPGASQVNGNIGLQLDLPLYDGGQRGIEARMKQLSQRETELQEQQLLRRIEVELEDARVQLQGAQAQLTALEKAVQAARANFDAVQAAAAAGRATPLEVADATTARAEAEVQQVLGILNRDLYHLTLMKTLGLSPLEGLQTPDKAGKDRP